MTNAEKEYEVLAAKMEELKARMIALSTQVHQDRAPGKTDDDARDHVASMADHVTNVKKAAIELKRQAEANLEALAKALQSPGESYEKAYVKALDTDMGKSLLATLEDSQALATGGPTAGQLDAHRKSLTV